MEGEGKVLHVVEQVVQLPKPSAKKLTGISFQNYFCSSIVIRPPQAAGDDAERIEQEVTLMKNPHQIDEAQNWFQVTLETRLVEKVLSQSNGENVEFVVRLSQSSLGWLHKRLELRHVRAMYAQDEIDGYPSVSCRDASSRVEMANKQLGLHLSVLEGLAMRHDMLQNQRKDVMARLQEEEE
mmetsp:Transcript_3533/g.6840  ORF Transcript_3533/g.6840 Transcript_3533/m.6840 type:complete len:182 (+) Transcript_3533:208-753(+)|eukprot:CAMPEP_0184507466 /NCGR_PEP_ID=MMETSP0198_2-20121128/256_1 /TAXON_ID=1112570 /ORGANISM="Thraustochytrium sp., Strain LLF1b" /LENGTH=181 /DNA_ID=CAMNT_0026897213 /DNA_START=201 /DNA_END=746 /DNA_ORIENTATION=-